MPAARSSPSPAAFRCASFTCACGTTHHSADGLLPVGWTARRGEVWCTDCTRLGIPTRILLDPPAGGRAQPRRRRA